MEENKNIHKEKFGFKVPKGYFNSLEDSLLEKVKSETTLHKSGFKVPEDYFTNFKVEFPTEEQPTKVIQFQDWSKWVAAASIIAISILGVLYIDTISPKNNVQFSDLDDEMIEKYLEYNLETPDEFIDFDNTSINTNLNFNITKLKDQDIIEYLNDKLDEQDFNDEN